MPTAKNCSRCGETKSLGEFYVVATGPSAGRVDSACKTCKIAIRTARYAARKAGLLPTESVSVQICRDCSQVKAVDQFGVDHARSNGLKAYCNPCVRNRWLQTRYGISTVEYDAMLEAQSGVCAICGGVETALSNLGQIRPLAVDHDHATGAIRGLLCDDCNVGLGRMKDSPDTLIAAAMYLSTRGASAQLAASAQRSLNLGVMSNG